MTTVIDPRKSKIYRKSRKIKVAHQRIRAHINFVKQQVNGTIFVGGYDNGLDCAVTCNEGEIL